MGIGLIVAGCAAIGLLIQRTALTVPKAGVADELEKLHRTSRPGPGT